VQAVDAVVRNSLIEKDDAFRAKHFQGGPIPVRIAIEDIKPESLAAQWEAAKLPVTLLASTAPDGQELGVLRVSLDKTHDSEADTVMLAAVWQEPGGGCSTIESWSVEPSFLGLTVKKKGTMYVMW